MTLNLDRKTPPDFKLIDNVTTLSVEKKILSNHIPVHIINGGMQDVVEFTLIFNAGSWIQDVPLTAYATSNQLIEGSVKYTSTEISEKMDFYGAYFYTEYDHHSSSLSLYTLKKYLAQTLEIVQDVIMNPTFPESELDLFVKSRKQQYLIDRQKVGTLSYEKFIGTLFGTSHPYGRTAKLNDFDNITRQMLIDFHKKYYLPSNCEIFVSGKTDETTAQIIEQFFGANSWSNDRDISKFTKIISEPVSSTEKKHFVEKENAVQCSIRIGKRTINKAHPDYIKLQVVNTILGGYMGSRLMANIREDKGYTYGISSSMASYRNDGFFVISCETGVEFYTPTLEEIYKELKKLRSEEVGDEELQMVKNHLLGEALRAFDGPFNHSDIYKNLLEYGFTFSYIDDYIATIQHISKAEIMLLSEKYFHEDTMFEITAGAQPKQIEL